ncbi:MAG: hypothetical protein A2X25_14525 [Chloroflexi bacterium GWB2_49_20]|nr:MAG: hypothetical protein A2X25_14525 [Chloroflexi bacterium GWB2_49_20]OGN77271.1 MAG: hypothetical protein A2X26_08720 [Chloroflexi bacterium GWC2_49_37]OGN84732.1 MAG: hypothetical protein A2X27_15385 [Chloroflexi bacterium GWD2_49_16]HBG75105.1 hypothetical protein [Anaerolineae bacterium]HCC78456.1 hypothetical protein [Anaerolineae bacterium]
MALSHYKPDNDRINVLIATILLAYALTRVINTPDYIFRVNLADIHLAFSLNINMAISFLAGGLAATGVDWLLRGHPSIQPGETIEHWLLPTLMALVMGIALYALPTGVFWWVGFGLGGILLVVIFRSEYAAVDPGDTSYPLATATLTALSYTLVLILAVALRSTGARLVLLSVALFITSGLASLRVLHLRLNERWEFGWAIGIALIATQLGAALHYWPLTPVQYGLALLGPVYALTSLAVSLIEGVPFRQAMIEPAIILGLLWGLAFFLKA